jgi:uncharacterized membrane protein YqjE
VKIPRTALVLLGLVNLLALSIIVVGDSLAIALSCVALVLAVLACGIIAGSHHNQRFDRLGREADAQNRPPGSKEGQS